MKCFRTLMGVVLALGCIAASAQWAWVDKEGRKVFSDRAPPPDIEDKNILKQPGLHGGSTSAQTATPAMGTPEPSADTGIDKTLEAQKKLAKDAEAAQRKTEEEATAKRRSENCARAKQAKSTLDSGIRIAQTNAAGEREVLDDAARATEAKRIQGMIDSDCK